MFLPDPPIRAKDRLPAPHLGDRNLFPDLRSDVYLNHAAISPPSLHVRHMLEIVPNSFAELGTDAFGLWVAQRNRLREALAELIGGQSDDIGLVPNTSMGLISIAMCIDWQPGDSIILFDGEFPTNITPWQRAALHFDLNLCMLSLDGFSDSSGAGLAQLEQALKNGCRLVAVSAVQFQTGLAMPLDDMAKLCRKYGAMLCVDAIQAVGCIPIDVEKIQPDFLVSGSHKWLMGLEGCGFVYIAPHRIPRLIPRLASWLSHENGLGFLFDGAGHLRYDRPIRQRADWIEVGAQNTIGFAALEASVDLLLHLGIQPIYKHIQLWINSIEPLLLERGFQSMRHPEPSGQSGILSVKPPNHWPLIPLAQYLNQNGISVSTPDGYLRLAPHWPNSLSEVERAVSTIDAYTP